MNMNGKIVTFEGLDGSGKTTQLRLLETWLIDHGYSVVVVREPGGTRIGEKIRNVLHDCVHTEMSPQAEILLYSASRAQLVAEVIVPALHAGKLVLCDRYADSTYAYQGYGRGLPLNDLYAITQIATQKVKPDLTLYFDILPEIGLQRCKQDGIDLDRMECENLEFHQKVRNGYLVMANSEPQRWKVIDASKSISIVQAAVIQFVQSLLYKI